MTEIEYIEVEEKKLGQFDDIPQMKKEVIEKLEKKKIEEETKTELGEGQKSEKPPVKDDSIPKELPKLIFTCGSKVLKCERFRIDDEEAKVLAKHMSILIGAQNSKIYSIIIILVIVISKLADCWEAVAKLLDRKKKPESEETQKIYDQTKNSEVKE